MKKLLIIQLTRLGDTVQTLLLLKRLKQVQPSCFITVLAVQEFSYFLQSSPFVDRLVLPTASDIMELQRSGHLALDAHPPLLERYDTVINLTHTPTGGFFAREVVATAKFGLIGNQHHQGQVRGTWAKYVFASQRNRRQNLFNIVDMQIGIGNLAPAPVTAYLPVTEDEVKNARRLLKASGHTGKNCLIGLQLGANQRHKAWPVANFAALARSLLNLPEVEIALFGNSSEQDLASCLTDQLQAPVIDLVGKTKLTDLPGLLKCCNLLVSNDTGPIHIAAAVGTKTLGLYFATVYMGETAPYGTDHMILQTELPCAPCHLNEQCETMTCRDTIPVALVQQLVESMLFARSRPGWDFSDVCAYRSRFLANGTLAYVPIPNAPLTANYMSALIHQTMWAPILGLETDWGFLAECWSRLAPPEELRETIAAVQQQVRQWRNLYLKAIGLVSNASSILTTPPINSATLQPIHAGIQGIEASITSFGSSILKDYHMLTMAELDYGDYPRLVSQLLRSYPKLSQLTTSFLQTLSRLSQSVDEAFPTARQLPRGANRT